MTTETKCPVCGKAVGIGLVSGLLVQHENKYGESCEGGGGPAAVASRQRSTATARSAPASKARGSSAPRDAISGGSSSRRGVSVRRVEVDPERLRRLEERQQRLREERAAAARARNEFYSSGIEIDDDESQPDAP